jgi:cell division protein FtsW
MAYKPSSDKVLFITVLSLTVLGLLMVYSASSVAAADKHGDPYHVFLRQLTFAVFGFLVLVGLMHMDYHIFQKPKVLAAILCLTTAALGFVFTQQATKGAHRWIHISKNIQFQPSEFAKLAVLIFIAWFLHTYGKELNRRDRLAAVCVPIAIFAGLIYKEPDLGQAVTLCMVAVILLIIAGLAWRYIAAACLCVVPLFYFFVCRVPYRWSRVLEFFSLEKDTKGVGWQTDQALIAVGSGGFWGLGPGDGKQKLFFLPESSTDFIFAIICEEWGLIGAALVVIGFMVFFYRGMKIAMKSQDKFGFYLGVGITLMVVLQGLINISMVLDMLPTKGIALPFISQGGSSLLMNLAATGILLNLSCQNKITEAAE